MEILLTTLNSKFIHSNLAIRYLKEYVRDIVHIKTMEFTINQQVESVVAEIFKINPDMVGFSTYIWNIEMTMEICRILKVVLPDIKILLGGPEVSYDSVEVLQKNSFIDYIIYGEGEDSFRELIESKDLCDIKGLVFRNERNEIVINPPRGLLKNLDNIPSPYDNVGDEFKNRIVYYESSRGCPFNCEFCLSSTIKGVRYFTIDRVKNDLKNLILGGVSQVKFVDRTFNANKEYSREIMEFIMEINPDEINFHFEVTAHLIDDETMEFLKTPKEGLFQFEIGVQSTNPRTIDAIGRVTDFERLKYVTNTIKSYKNIHQHLDLIVGLPYEDYNSFRNSFNDIYPIKAEKLQLGFLKLLKGSGLRISQKEYGYKYIDKPPYEVLESNWLSFGEVLRLKDIENLVERYYNEGNFSHSLEFTIRNFFLEPFKFYEDMANYWEENKLDDVSHSRKALYEIFLKYYNHRNFPHQEVFKEILKFDFLFNNGRASFPAGLERNLNNLNQIELHEILKNEKLLNTHLLDYKDIPTKKLINKVVVEVFKNDVLSIIENDYIVKSDDKETFILFDYRNGIINRCITHDISELIIR